MGLSEDSSIPSNNNSWTIGETTPNKGIYFNFSKYDEILNMAI
jgi:hypothetical protein